MSEKILFVSGELLFNTLFFNDKSTSKFDNDELVRFTVKNAKINYGDLTDADAPEFKTKWYGLTVFDFVNVKSKYELKVYDSNNKLTRELPNKNAKVTVCFKVTEKTVYPTAIRIDKQSDNYNPFDR